jgi:micrococcal nuclease
MKAFILIIIFIISFQNTTFNALVIGIHDGDSITVLTSENQQIKVRLEGIDCPELKQDFGQRAKLAASDLCFNKQVRVVQTGKDRYKRTLAFVYVGDVCVNKELLKQGMAWHFKKYNHDPELANLEKEARSAKRGLWSQPAPIPPWEFRK